MNKDKHHIYYIKRQRQTVQELLDSIEKYMHVRPELRDSTIVDVSMETSESSITDGAVIFSLVHPDYGEGVLTVPVNRSGITH